jgi:hypothetical protein
LDRDLDCIGVIGLFILDSGFCFLTSKREVVMKYCWLLLLLVCSSSVVAGPKINIQGAMVKIKTSRYEARLDGASLVYFKDILTGENYLTAGGNPTLFVRLVQNKASVTIRPDKSTKFTAKRTSPDTVRIIGKLTGQAGTVILSIDVRALNGELLMSGAATAKGPVEGVASIGFTTGLTSKQGKVIVPNRGNGV